MNNLLVNRRAPGSRESTVAPVVVGVPSHAPIKASTARSISYAKNTRLQLAIQHGEEFLKARPTPSPLDEFRCFYRNQACEEVSYVGEISLLVNRTISFVDLLHFQRPFVVLIKGAVWSCIHQDFLRIVSGDVITLIHLTRAI